MQIALANRPRIAVFVKNLIKAAIDPIRQNNLRARRRKLGLSRVALGRILGVDPATVFRHERGRMDGLWDYALRGIEAEAAEGKQFRRQYKTDLDRQTFIPDQLDARGWSYTAEKMHEARRQHAQRKARPDKPGKKQTGTFSERRSRELSKEQIKRIADRAEESAKRSK
jgi:DNA-binding XRE family transcriptional regulator